MPGQETGATDDRRRRINGSDQIDVPVGGGADGVGMGWQSLLLLQNPLMTRHTHNRNMQTITSKIWRMWGMVIRIHATQAGCRCPDH